MFGAGCFWGVEAAFRKVKGVKKTQVGYSGGKTSSPSYEQVCRDKTGHAEVVQIEFDPKQVSYEQLLEIFWNCHDPTTVNRQGPDVGTQYRSVIFFYNQNQKKSAILSKENVEKSKKYKAKIVTQIIPFKKFYKAEEYHQQYLEKRGRAVCHF